MCGQSRNRCRLGHLLLIALGAGMLLATAGKVPAQNSAPAAAPAAPATPAPAPAAAGQSTTSPATLAIARELIAQLGDDQFATREAATVRLSQMGIEIKPALLAAVASRDAEVRLRARRILSHITDDDLQKRLTAFAEDVNDTKHLDLPGWARFRKLVATDGAARKFFVEMQRSEMSLLDACEGDPQQAARQLETRIRVAQNSLYQVRTGLNAGGVGAAGPSLACTSALTFAATDPRIALSDETAMMLVNLQFTTSFNQGLRSGADAELLRRLFALWVARDASPAVLWQNLSMSMQLNLKEALEPSLKALKQPAQLAGHVRQIAIMAVGRFGGKEHLPALAPFLKDTEICGQYSIGRTMYVTQVRDAALVITLRLAGEDPKTYGFNRLEANDQMVYQIQTIGFGSQADRDAAFKKWDDYQAAHPAKTAPPAKAAKS